MHMQQVFLVKMGKFLVRLTVSAIHTKDQIENLLELLKKWRDKHGTGSKRTGNGDSRTYGLGP